ncbi:DEAD/DEAH box helicase [Paraclostridium sordellii]|uniref:DEAD/DEAH box helicase n=1 Tax=Paraclostridium sordellii TaxID=1505 RepID=UPI0005E104C5|nr:MULTISPECIES: DEAD/DEAH box helicase [Paeniclostridium]MBW4861223.1 DEAD/DEAH box helicase [Paeniclostridium sp.]MBW4874330.1 DEAD/DEAH box helicase [Paeniclostridium sp.]MCH1964904.1 DEAD/DEAH box helicase [Paeniclostridium sordellii]CEN85592.1 ATP-dependent RNA helicase RhlE [[Clostridium] sordellii] [Paeniclostridium sordellii]CEO14804.1 ATP-dependent RNA helicase RhlE [[Clostridium] sordellii] [Paeniclostridium sordellii]
MLFTDLDIIKPIQKALKEEGYLKPTPIQSKSITPLLEGRDLLGCAQTGTGKTASFAIPIIQQIYNDKKALKGKRTIKAVILAPTRELAIQIEENFAAYARYTNIKSLVIFGGVSQNAQTKALKQGVDILIATPGRMIDLYNQKFLKLNDVKHFVLDEADSMLDMGMIHDVKRIMNYFPKVRQNIFFSATMPKEISKLADSIFKNPVRVEVAPVSSTTEMVDQNIYFVSKKQKINLLIELLKNNPKESVLVFSRTKHGANKITKELISSSINAAAIHGNKSQNARQLALNDFKEGHIRVLVATDIAARGIDIDDLPYVINYDLPEVAETYVHRIGRTGRAGRSGRATAFCSMEERDLYKAIEKLINKKIKVVENHSFVSSAEDITVSDKKNNRGRRRPNRSNNNKNKDKFTNKN